MAVRTGEGTLVGGPHAAALRLARPALPSERRVPHCQQSCALSRLDVPVGVRRDRHGGMTKLPADDVQRDTLPEHLGGVCVAQFVYVPGT